MAQKILIVSNNKVTLDAIQKTFNGNKHSIITAQDGLEAVDLALDQQPSAIFLSVRLAHLAGLEVARALRAITPTMNVPIIFLAENQADARSVADAHLPFTECLLAPFDAAHVQALLASHNANGARAHEPRVESENAWMLALLDPLTRAYHRRYFMHRLAYEAARSARYHVPLAVLLVDVDNLNDINRDYGIVTGDAVLVEVAEHLKKLTRLADVVGRCDTQDFAILAPQIDAPGARELAQRVVKKISEQHFASDKLDLHVTVSVGVASVPGNDLTENLALLGKAENALDRAKRAGKNRVEIG
jgi:two-component system cell cycle response regulator